MVTEKIEEKDKVQQTVVVSSIAQNLSSRLKKSLQNVWRVTSSALVTVTERFPARQVYTRVFVFISSMSIRYKIAGALIFVLLLAIAALGVATFSKQKQVLEEEMKKRAAVLVQQLASVGKEGILTKQELLVFSTIKELQENSGVAYAMVLSADGKIFVHNLLTEKGKTLTGAEDQNALKSDQLLFQETVYLGKPVLDASLPIISKVKNIRIGTARVGLSEEELIRSIAKQKMAFFWISAGFVTLGLLISFALSRVLTYPIYMLALGMQVVAQGDLSQQVRVWYRDEIGRLTELFNQMILNLREKLQMEKYLSLSVLKSIKRTRDAAKLKLGGERKTVTALFSDVRGFTSMSEKMSPEEVVSLLNIYLNLQGKVVMHRGGAVDKFVGDEVMAIFEGKGQEINAVRAAVEIQNYCKALNWSRSKLGKKQMQVGIGLNSGDVVMGNMGSEEQMNYTVIGDTINLAARLCSAAQPGQVVISKIVADALKKEAKLNELDPILVKGKEKPIEIYEVLEITGVLRRAMRRGIEVEAIYRLAGLSEEANSALAKNISPSGCLLEVPIPVGVGSKLHLEIRADGIPYLKEVAGVVQHARKYDSKYLIGLSFERLSEKTKNLLIDWIYQVESEIIQENSA